MGELLDRLRAVTVFDAQVWKPAPGEGIEGTVLAVETRRADEHRRISAYPIYRIRDDNGQAWIWHASATMAQESLNEQGSPVAGDRIAVLFGGESKAGNGNKFERWAVMSEPSRARTLHERMVAVPDTETRNRIKRTSSRLHGSLLRLDTAGLDTVDAWLDRAIAGEEELDPI